MQAQGFVDLFLERIDEIVFAARELRFEVEVPVRSNRWLELRFLERQQMPGRQLVHTAEHGVGRGDESQREILIERFEIQPAQRRIEGEQALDLGREREAA